MLETFIVSLAHSGARSALQEKISISSGYLGLTFFTLKRIFSDDDSINSSLAE